MTSRQKIDRALRLMQHAVCACFGVAMVRVALYVIVGEYMHAIDCAMIAGLSLTLHIMASLGRDLLSLMPDPE